MGVGDFLVGEVNFIVAILKGRLMVGESEGCSGEESSKLWEVAVVIRKEETVVRSDGGWNRSEEGGRGKIRQAMKEEVMASGEIVVGKLSNWVRHGHPE